MTDSPVLEALPNGVRLVHLPAELPYTALSLWWQAGSRHEASNEHGYAHLMEHALFCGAGPRSAEALDQAIDRLGGQVNAETGREWLGLHGIVPAVQQDELGALLADMALEPRLELDALETETRALAGELASLAGDPLESAANRALGRLWLGTSAGRTVEGDPALIRTIDAGGLLNWWAKRRVGPRLTVTTVGPDAAGDALLARLETLPTGDRVLDAHVPTGNGSDRPGAATVAGAWAFPVPFSTLPQRCNARLAAALLGGALSSPITRRLRDAGIYHHQCWIESIQGNAACVLAVAGNRPGETGWIDVVEDTLERLTRDGPGFPELETVRRSALARLTLAAIDPVGWAHQATDDLLALGHVPRREDIHEGLASVTTETLHVRLGHWRERVFAVTDV